ncbi:MAG: alanine racemase [Desulfobacterales bacterium]|nr:alanine racemase [Desulfobacterales bacterium]
MNSSLIWTEIDIAALGHNIRLLKQQTKPHTQFMAVVKANAYGHGMINVAKHAQQFGASFLGVARLEEAIHLREANIDCPILILGYTPYCHTAELIHYRLIPSIFSLETAKGLSTEAQKIGKSIKIHVKIDTGMGRLGFVPDLCGNSIMDTIERGQTIKEIITVSKLPFLELQGIFTHFASADSPDPTYTQKQLLLFIKITDELREHGIHIPLKHAANSAGIMFFPDSHLDMVRAGIAMYGLAPSGDVEHDTIHLKPVMSLKSKIVFLKKVPANFNVSYGKTYKTHSETLIATVPVGYADGLDRLLSSSGYMIVKGQRVPIIGRVCMDLTMIDVGKIPNVQVGDEVVVFGTQERETISVDEIARQLKTINYEIVSTIMDRVPRIEVMGE